MDPFQQHSKTSRIFNVVQIATWQPYFPVFAPVQTWDLCGDWNPWGCSHTQQPIWHICLHWTLIDHLRSCILVTNSTKDHSYICLVPTGFTHVSLGRCRCSLLSSFRGLSVRCWSCLSYNRINRLMMVDSMQTAISPRTNARKKNTWDTCTKKRTFQDGCG